MTMASSLELVDRTDQDSVHARFEHIPRQGGDLFLKVENDDASSIATTEDYIGLELEVQIERRAVRRRKRALLFALMVLMAVVASVIYAKSGSNPEQVSKPSNSQPNNPTVAQPTEADDDAASNDTAVDEDTEIELWPTAAPLPAFPRCAPQVTSSRGGLAVFHMMDVRIIPESPTKDDYVDEWEYTFSSMDINEEASLIAVGMSDFSANTDYSVGLVRAFAFDCSKQVWKQLGQDLLGTNLYDQFGHHVSSSRDGTVMAIAAPQDQAEGGKMDLSNLPRNNEHIVIVFA